MGKISTSVHGSEGISDGGVGRKARRQKGCKCAKRHMGDARRKYRGPIAGETENDWYSKSVEREVKRGLPFLPYGLYPSRITNNWPRMGFLHTIRPNPSSEASEDLQIH